MVMFEINIGLFLDVGGGWFLVCVFGNVGEYLGVMGQMIEVVDVLLVGFVDCYVIIEVLLVIVQCLYDGNWSSVEQIVVCFIEVVLVFDDVKVIIVLYCEVIDDCFSQGSV